MASKRKKNKMATEHLEHLKQTVQTPSFTNLLPLLIVKGVFNFIRAVPIAIRTYQKAKADELAAEQAEKERLQRNKGTIICFFFTKTRKSFFFEFGIL